MEKLSKLGIGVNGLVGSVCSLLQEWHPQPFKTENEYSDAIAAQLRMMFPSDTRVEREYRHEGTTADVCLLYSGMLSNDQVFFEVKRSLRRKSDYDRLVGQIEGLKPDKYHVVVVLVGETDAALLGRLKEHYKRRLEEGIGEQAFRIVVVS